MRRPLNLNKASIEELAILPDVGDRIAKLVVDARENGGRFCNTSGLIAIAGMTQPGRVHSMHHKINWSWQRETN